MHCCTCADQLCKRGACNCAHVAPACSSEAIAFDISTPPLLPCIHTQLGSMCRTMCMPLTWSGLCITNLGVHQGKGWGIVFSVQCSLLRVTLWMHAGMRRSSLVLLQLTSFYCRCSLCQRRMSCSYVCLLLMSDIIYFYPSGPRT
jgi:hypothetical protein